MTNKIQKKIIKTLIYNPKLQELADTKGHTRQAIYYHTKRIPKTIKNKINAKRLGKIKAIMEE